MSDSATLTPPQSGVIDQLIEQHGEGQVLGDVDGGVIYEIGERRWKIGPRGGLTELQPSAGVGDGGLDPADERQPNPSGHLSEGEQGESTTDEAPVVDPPAQTSTDLTVPEDQRVFQALTAADERQIIAEIEGRALGAMVYSFRQGGNTVTGLSWKGIQEAVRQMNTRGMGRIRVTAQPPVFEEITVKVANEQRKAVRCTVYAEDEAFGSGRWGTATQLREMKKRDGTWIDDTFADAKALSKAQRNAMEGMLPLELVEELKQAYLGTGQVEYISSTAVDITDQPPALTDDRAKELGDEIRELYETFKRTHPDGIRAYLPAAFNRHFEASQHDHDRLEDFKAHMEQRVDEAREAQEAANA